MTDQISIPTVFMRGGTSKGLLFDKRDLPSEEKKISKYLLAAMGSPDTVSYTHLTLPTILLV